MKKGLHKIPPYLTSRAFGVKNLPFAEAKNVLGRHLGKSDDGKVRVQWIVKDSQGRKLWLWDWHTKGNLRDISTWSCSGSVELIQELFPNAVITD